MYGILGSGFGLYGYLPAILQTEKYVVLLAKSKQIFLDREDINTYFNSIIWVENMDELIDLVDDLIICVPPKIQEKLVDEIISKGKIPNLILEKPLSFSPENSLLLLEKLLKNNVHFRISYLFLYTVWYKDLCKIYNTLNTRDNQIYIEITWLFKAHHYINNLWNWKRIHTEGGGTIRFFAIHLIALMASFNLDEVKKLNTTFNESELTGFYLSLTSNSNKNTFCSTLIDTNSNDTTFKICVKDKLGFIYFDRKLKTPFDEENYNNNKADIRLSTIRSFINRFKNHYEDNFFTLAYHDTINLWNKIEKIIFNHQNEII